MYVVEISGKRFKHALYFTEWIEAVAKYLVCRGLARHASIHVDRDYMVYHKDIYLSKYENGIHIKLDVVESDITRTDEQYKKIINELREL